MDLRSPTANPVLVEVTRGTTVESFHRGAMAVVDADGALHTALGDIDRPIFPRSAVKVLQALPLVESGAADRFVQGRDVRLIVRQDALEEPGELGALSGGVGAGEKLLAGRALRRVLDGLQQAREGVFAGEAVG